MPLYDPSFPASAPPPRCTVWCARCSSAIGGLPYCDVCPLIAAAELDRKIRDEKPTDDFDPTDYDGVPSSTKGTKASKDATGGSAEVKAEKVAKRHRTI